MRGSTMVVRGARGGGRGPAAGGEPARVVPVAAAVIVAVCAATVAARAQDRSAEFAGIADKLSVEARPVALYRHTDVAEGRTNPDNRVKAIPSHEIALQLRNKLAYQDRDRGVLLRLEPRVQYEHETVDQGPLGGEDGEDETEVFLSGYLAQLRGAIPRSTVTLARQRVQWSPGYLAGPSNPFNLRESTDNPLEEEPGSDFLWLSTSPTDRLSLSYYLNYGEGAEDHGFDDIEEFQRTHAGVVTYYADRFALNGVVGHQEEDGPFVGSFGQWTVNEAAVLYYDAAAREGSRGFYPEADPAQPTGGDYVREREDDGRIYPEILIGGSYTDLRDITYYLEYLYYGPGYGNDELDRSRAILERAEELIDSAPALALGTIGQAARPGVAFLGKHFINLQASTTVSGVNLIVQNAVALQDGTGRLFASADYAFGAARVALSGLVTYGREAGVFTSDVDGLVTLAVAYRF